MILKEPYKYRSVFISDVHLGFRGCNAKLLTSFLRNIECEYLYLVGDIIDIWSLKSKKYWPQSHNNVVRTILGKAKHNTKVIYITGNHDEMIRDYGTLMLGNVFIKEREIHTTADNKKFLVLHGDQFDGVVKYQKWLSKLGSVAYDYLLLISAFISHIRNKFNLPHWSLSNFLKYKVKNAVSYISSYEKAVSHTAEKEGVDGIVCGHIHHAEISMINEVKYMNCGDWVESCTALVETHDGEIQLIKWSDVYENLLKENNPVVKLRTG